MILASPIGGYDLASRQGSSPANSFRLWLASWATSVGARFALGRRSPDPLCRDLSAEAAALEKALDRASGTWGGFQASRPFIHRPQD